MYVSKYVFRYLRRYIQWVLLNAIGYHYIYPHSAQQCRNVRVYIYMYIYIYIQFADICFAVLQLISATQNEHGLIREQSARTVTQAVGIA